MNLLLDTNIFLWFITDDSKITHALDEIISTPQNRVFVSSASIWEAVIKNQKGKLPLPQDGHEYLILKRQQSNFESLAISEEAVSFLSDLPPVHRDPFDRILICQAIENDLTLVTSDATIKKYPVKTI